MKRIITIGREFGSGGSDLGRRLARELGIPYYDRDIILRTAKASAHLTPEQVRQWDERVPMEFGFTQSLFNFYSRPLSEELWNAQVKATTVCGYLSMRTEAGGCCGCASPCPIRPGTSCNPTWIPPTGPAGPTAKK